jgi:hypothetical protein
MIEKTLRYPPSITQECIILFFNNDHCLAYTSKTRVALFHLNPFRNHNLWIKKREWICSENERFVIRTDEQGKTKLAQWSFKQTAVYLRNLDDLKEEVKQVEFVAPLQTVHALPSNAYHASWVVNTFTDVHVLTETFKSLPPTHFLASQPVQFNEYGGISLFAGVFARNIWISSSFLWRVAPCISSPGV